MNLRCSNTILRTDYQSRPPYLRQILSINSRQWLCLVYESKRLLETISSIVFKISLDYEYGPKSLQNKFTPGKIEQKGFLYFVAEPTSNKRFNYRNHAQQTIAFRMSTSLCSLLLCGDGRCPRARENESAIVEKQERTRTASRVFLCWPALLTRSHIDS